MSHEAPIACGRVIGSFENGSQFLKTCPCTSNFGVHWRVWNGEISRSCIAASAVTGLNVEPGG